MSLEEGGQTCREYLLAHLALYHSYIAVSLGFIEPISSWLWWVRHSLNTGRTGSAASLLPLARAAI